MYSQQQNKWNQQRFLLTHFEASLYFRRTEYTWPYNNLWLYLTSLRKAELRSQRVEATFNIILIFTAHVNEY